ncbi:MAG: hypothetical protein CMN30_14740 [Sandaracinus sp.]|nr:hypothetical protein [Sandaracinus sp.]|tara:strand:- start:2100 stop:2843 length:744 start_codon:yes stop_codon:yes gene_type:complete
MGVMRPAFLLCLALAVGAVAQTATAHAQSADANREQARAAFQRGQQAADGGRWADALREFEQAYMMSGVPTALFNAGMALRALGRHREARDTFQRILDSHPDSPAAEQSRAMRDEEGARVAVLELAGLDPNTPVEIRLDGRRIDVPVETVTELEVDPGQHGVSAEREGYRTFSWEGRLGDGQRERITVVMEPLPEQTRPAPEERSILRSPWLWVAVAVVVVGAGAGVAIWLTRDDAIQPGYDNVFEL